MHIRPAENQDASRIAEILVFNNRVNYWPIFKDDAYSFGKLTVLAVAEEYRENHRKPGGISVYDDGIIKGFVHVEDGEIRKLYVDTFFQGNGIGAALFDYAVSEHSAKYLWALEKNVRALSFYQKHGFHLTGDRTYEEGTTEWLVKLER